MAIEEKNDVPMDANALMTEDVKDKAEIKDTFNLTKTEYRQATKLKEHVSGTGAPTYTPKNFFEQFYLQKDGSTYYMWVYTNNLWKKVTLT